MRDESEEQPKDVMADTQPEWFKSWANEVGGGQKLEEARLSLVAAALTIDGDLESAYPLHIAGTVKGAVKGAERVTVETGGVVRGRIDALDLFVAGRVEGDVAAKSVQVADGGRIEGDVRYSTLAVEPGAVLVGTLTKA